MRFPFSLTRTMTTYLLKKKLSGNRAKHYYRQAA